MGHAPRAPAGGAPANRATMAARPAAFARRRPGLTLKDRQLVAHALRQFFLAYLKGGRRFASMPSQAADDLWHEFILYTKHYHAFCGKAFGRFLHHSPAITLGPKRLANAGLRRVWWHACLEENINPRRPTRLPLLFALDRKLGLAAASALAAALLVSCNGGGGDGGGPPLLGATPGSDVTIYAFNNGTASPQSDGAEPKGTLTAATVNGQTVLFGRTAIGGSNGCGTIFSINPDGSNYNVQYRFGGADGSDPRHDAMIVNPNDGKLYGTTQGVNQTIANPPPPNTYGNWGQIFSFTPATSIPTPINAVHTFASPSPTAAPFDGAQQHSAFSIDPVTGMLYGQSAAGGATNDGMPYAVSPDGSQFTDLHDFSKDDGRNPHGRIVLLGGVLYGIARSDGKLPGGSASSSSYGFGTVYAYTLTAPLANGPVSVLHVFAGAPNDGAFSDHGYLTPVTIGGKTILFGMTQCGGAGPKNSACKGNGDGSGVVFQIDPTATPGSAAAFGIVFRFAPVAMGGTATPTLLYQFGANANDGIKPIDNVIKVGNTLYGMTVYGGASGPSPDDPSVNGSGTVFAIPLPN